MRRFSFTGFKTRIFLLVFFASLAGCLTGYSANETYYSMMRRAASGSVSIVCLFAQASVPLLMSVLAVTRRKTFLLAFIVLSKVFLFSFAVTCVVIMILAGDNPSYLLLLFQDICIMPLLCWLWFQFPKKGSIIRWHCYLSFLLLVLGVVFVNDRYIAPLLV